jgi:hypothetical protein
MSVVSMLPQDEPPSVDVKRTLVHPFEAQGLPEDLVQSILTGFPENKQSFWSTRNLGQFAPISRWTAKTVKNYLSSERGQAQRARENPGLVLFSQLTDWMSRSRTLVPQQEGEDSVLLPPNHEIHIHLIVGDDLDLDLFVDPDGKFTARGPKEMEGTLLDRRPIPMSEAKEWFAKLRGVQSIEIEADIGWQSFRSPFQRQRVFVLVDSEGRVVTHPWLQPFVVTGVREYRREGTMYVYLQTVAEPQAGMDVVD